MPDTTHLEVLHDHYKDSFSYIREREKERDRLFLVLIALFVLLAFEIQYATDFLSALSAITIMGVKANLSALPLAALLGATWLFVLAITLRYCQATINVERQYEYLHTLEKKISARLGDDELYRREGRAYEKKYPIFSEWAWRFYVDVLPLIVASAVVVLAYQEFTGSGNSLVSRIIDAIIAGGVILSFILFRIASSVGCAAKKLWSLWKRLLARVRNKEHSDHSE